MDEFARFAEWLREHDRSEVTIRGYLADLRAFAEWFKQTNGQPLQVKAITPMDVREYRAWFGRHHAAGTVRRRLMAVRAFCRWGVATGRIEYDPTHRVKMPRNTNLAPKWLNKQEQWRLLREAERAIQAANTPTRRKLAVRDRAMLVFLLNTGLRVSEICALDIGDVTIRERSGGVEVRRGKGNKSRWIPLNATARNAIQAWLAERGEQGGRLFDLTPSTVFRRVAELGRRAGISVHPHTLRHTLAKNLVDAGVELHEVAAILGHSNLNTTRVYTVPGQRDLERAMSRLDE